MIVFTTAPDGYDYGYTKELERDVARDSRGRVIRKVEIQDDRQQDQTDRYSSGLHMAVDTTEFQKLVQYKLVTLTESK